MGSEVLAQCNSDVLVLIDGFFLSGIWMRQNFVKIF